MAHHHLKRVVAACAALCAAAAGAETLPVGGVYPAGSDAAAALGSIAVERFGGTDGQQLGIAVADKLRAVTIDGEPYFRIVPARSSSEVDAVLQGTATAEVGRRDAGTREDEVCVERDEDRKCVRREKQKIPCWNQVVRLDASVRLVAIEGDLLHAFDRGDEQSQRYCEGDSRPSSEGMVRQLVTRYADGLRGELAPIQRFEDVRVMESRDDLSRADGRAFREAVRLTKTDGGAACAAWSALEEANPSHVGVLFNLGLCAESEGRLDDAYRYYERALAVDDDSNYAGQGVRRIEDRRRADEQLARQRGL